MQLARVIGEVVATIKDANLTGIKLLVLQPLAASGEPVGRTLVALDSVGAGVGEHVFFVRGREAAFPVLSGRAADRCRDRRHRRSLDASDRGLRQMQIARVVGTVSFDAEEPQARRRQAAARAAADARRSPRGVALLAIDSVGAGVGEKVLVVIEGKAAGDALGRKARRSMRRSSGIVDTVGSM